MIFYANPLNDPLNPVSKMNPFHEENILLRGYLTEETVEGELMIEWPSIAPYANATLTALLCFVIDLVSRVQWLQSFLLNKVAGTLIMVSQSYIGR